MRAEKSKVLKSVPLGSSRREEPLAAVPKSDKQIAFQKKAFLLAKYASGSLFLVSVKLLCTYGLLEIFNPFTAYLLVHLIILVGSYTYHSLVTFGTKLSVESFVSYFWAMIGFKALDYFVFSFAFVALEIDAIWCVLLASLVILVARFSVVDRVLMKFSKENPDSL